MLRVVRRCIVPAVIHQAARGMASEGKYSVVRLQKLYADTAVTPVQGAFY